MIFDSHCHYNLPPLYQNWPQHWQKAQEHGVEKAWVVGTNLESSQKAIEIAQTDPRLSATIGISPHHYQAIPLAELETTVAQQAKVLTKLLEIYDQQEAQQDEADQQIVALGETGLDYYRLKDDDQATPQKQEAGFKMQIELANQFNKWLVVHARDKADQAYWDVLRLIEKYYQGKQPFILHCLSGPKAYLKKALSLGAYVGVGGNVTYKNSDHLRQLVELVPPERLLTETDAPYLAPQKYRGQTCEPWMIAETDQYLQKLKKS